MNTRSFRADLPAINVLTVKVGSRIVSDRDQARLHARLTRLVEDIEAVRRLGVRVILVSSGAIAHGMGVLNLEKRPKTIPMKQACASVGQIRLMGLLENLFARHRMPIGQVLLTWDDLRDKQRYLNLRNTLFQLLECGAVPVINENDSVGVEEIRFGNNDTLGAQVAMVSVADVYVMLTDVDGLYDSNPRTNPQARHIALVPEVTAALHGAASGAGSEAGVGGMATKLKAAEMVTRAGIPAVIGNGLTGRLMDALCSADMGTLFLPSARRMSSRSRWLAFSRHASGRIVVDDGARQALVHNGKSLLPAGVKKVTGTFKAGDLVEVAGEDGAILARGLVNYASGDVEKIRGSKTSGIAAALGHKTFDEVIHRDNLVLL